jgi:hypothetical protein
LANVELRRRGQPTGRLQPATVDEGAIGRPEIRQPRTALGDVELGMSHGDLRIVNHQMTVRRPTQDMCSHADVH